MKIDVLTIFPEMFTAVKSSILGKAEERGILDINLINIRDYTLDKHKKLMIILLVEVSVCSCRLSRFFAAWKV